MTIRNSQKSFFYLDSAWKDHWWGMPEFTADDTSPQYRIVLNFMTRNDIKDLATLIGIPINSTTKSIWYPPKKASRKFKYTGRPINNKYPICIPSKGRWEYSTTDKILDRMGISYKFFVEENEGDKYIEKLGENKVITMPFHDLNSGSIPARNYIWEWCKDREYNRHWYLDDNITGLYRLNKSMRIPVYGGGFFRAMEDFVDRYENIAMAGPHLKQFLVLASGAKSYRMPYRLNSRVYSCILINTNLPDRWRGKYNEDTDLSIRLLKQGHCTLLFNAFLIQKAPTAYSKNAKPLPGGNTDNVYNADYYRYRFAKSLEKQHPDIVKIIWRYGRWHHYIDYSIFRKNKLIPRPDIVPIQIKNEYGMILEDDISGVKK